MINIGTELTVNRRSLDCFQNIWIFSKIFRFFPKYSAVFSDCLFSNSVSGGHFNDNLGAI